MSFVKPIIDEDKEIRKLAQKNLLYLVEEHRRKTFKKWIYSEKQPCSAAKMAEAGFIYIGNKDSPDAVKCFVCEKTLDGWEPADDPWKEHIAHSANCMFAKLQKPTNLLTFIEISHIKEQLYKNAVNKYYDKIVEMVEDCFADLEKKLMKEKNK